MLSFKPAFSFFSFTLIKRLFISSSVSAVRVVSCAYLRLLIFLLAILIPACASSSPAFCMMYSASKLNKQGDSIQPDVLLSQFGTSLLMNALGRCITLNMFFSLEPFTCALLLPICSVSWSSSRSQKNSV